MDNYFTRLRLWSGALEWPILVTLLLIVGSAWLFIELADGTGADDQDFNRFDEELLLALREPQDRTDPIGSQEIEVAVRDITALGGAAVLGLITISSAILLALQGKRYTAIILVVSVAGGALLSTVFKDFYARPRPTLISDAILPSSFSFPSGHAMAAAVTYLTIGALLARTQVRPAIKVFVLAVAVFVTVAVGISRVYLGVHWPTDVLAGWLGGLVWALLVWLVARRL